LQAAVLCLFLVLPNQKRHKEEKCIFLEILQLQGENPPRFSCKSAKMATLLTASLWLLLGNCTKKNQTRISGYRQPSIENLCLLLTAN